MNYSLHIIGLSILLKSQSVKKYSELSVNRKVLIIENFSLYIDVNMDDNDGHLRILQKQTPTFFSVQNIQISVMSLSRDGDNHFEQP